MIFCIKKKEHLLYEKCGDCVRMCAWTLEGSHGSIFILLSAREDEHA